MFSDLPFRTKASFIVLVISVFICSAAFGYVFVIDGSVTADESKALMYATVFIIILLALNMMLLAVGWSAYRKIKQGRGTVKCGMCGASADISAKACPKCRAILPPSIDGSMYLEPKEREEGIKPKK